MQNCHAKYSAYSRTCKKQTHHDFVFKSLEITNCLHFHKRSSRVHYEIYLNMSIQVMIVCYNIANASKLYTWKAQLHPITNHTLKTRTGEGKILFSQFIYL